MAKEGFDGFNDTPSCEHFYVVTADPTAASPIEGAITMGQMMGSQPPEFDTISTNPEDTAVILYTSGTTGFPKGAELSHSNMTMNTLESKTVMEQTPNDVHVVALPLFHSFGQTCQMNSGFMSGSTLVLIPRFEPDIVLDAMQKEKVSIFAGVPTMYWTLLKYEDKENRFDLEIISNQLRIGISGASPLPLEIIKGIEEKYNIPMTV